MLKMLCILIVCTISSVLAHPQLNTNELSLERAISIALENNPDIKIAQSEVDASKGRFWKNSWLPSPKLTFTYEAVPQGSPLKNFGERYIEVSQSIEYPAGIYFKSMSLSKEIDAAGEQLTSRRHQITLQVKRMYYQAAAGNEKVRVQEKNLSVISDFLNKAEARLNIGEGTNLEFLTAQVQYKEALNLLDESKNNLRNALNDLKLSLGIDDTNEFEGVILTDSLTFSEYNITLDGLLRKAGQNPHVRTAELNLNKASYDNKFAWAKLMPGFDLAYFRETIGNDPGFYGVSLGVSIPLWFLFNERGEIQEASAYKRSAEYELRLKTAETVTGIKNSYNNYQNQKRQLTTYQNEILPLSEEVYRIAGASYDAGEISYLEFLQARQTLISARNNFIDVLLNYNLALISIEEALGDTLSNHSGELK